MRATMLSLLVCLTLGLMTAPPAVAYGSSCTTYGVPCTFTCDDGDDVGIFVYGMDVIPSYGSGSYSCGTASGGCSFGNDPDVYTCEAQSRTTTDGIGTCTLSSGWYATCWSNP